MDAIWRTALSRLFGAAMDMLDKALRACPDELWTESWCPDEFSGQHASGRVLAQEGPHQLDGRPHELRAVLPGL